MREDVVERAPRRVGRSSPIDGGGFAKGGPPTLGRLLRAGEASENRS